MTIRVLLVDDHEVVRAGLRTLLAEEPDFQVAGEAGSVAEAIAVAESLLPDVILMDLRLPDGSGVEACREILSAAPGIRVLFLTSHSDEQAIESTLLAGARGYLLKDLGHYALVRAIRDAAAGRPVLDSVLARPVAKRLEKCEALSGQERRILALVVAGKTNKEIAADLGLSDKTVKNYLSNAFQKLQVTRRAQAAALFAHRLQDPE
ncbi:MAG TPA: response regulator transcription factor [Burkholderiales bacterium]|nr:response regulator transcription factor [Burkholderiales bacterium]